MDTQSLYAFLMTLAAGLVTGLGGAIVVFLKKGSSDRFLSAALGFAAGIILAISLMDLIPESAELFIEAWGRLPGFFAALAMVVLGILSGRAIDRLVPHSHTHSHGEGEACPHESHDGKEEGPCEDSYRLGLITTVAIMAHNLPEGMVAFMMGYSDVTLGLSMALAIALHNIPVGMAISLPLYYAGEKRSKAIGCAFAAGMVEPLGALLAYLVLRPYLSSLMMAGLFGFIAGFMLYLALDELLPSSRGYGYGKLSFYSLMAGVAVMGVGIFLV